MAIAVKKHPKVDIKPFSSYPVLLDFLFCSKYLAQNCSCLYWYATLNYCKYLKSETHLRNAQANKASSVNKRIVKICLVVDMVRTNWSWIVVGCGLHCFISPRIGLFWVFTNFNTAEMIKYLFLQLWKFIPWRKY